MSFATRLRFACWVRTSLVCGALFGCARPPSAAPLGGSDPAPLRVAESDDAGTPSEGAPAEKESREDVLVAEADPAGTNARSANAEPTPLAAPDAGDGVAFVAYPIRAGDVLTMRLRFGVNVGMTMPIEGLDELEVDMTAEQETRTEYLQVDGGKVVKYRVEYLKEHMRGTMMGTDHSEVSPLVGNTYLIDESGGRFVVRRADGRKVSAEEEAELREKHQDSDEKSGDGDGADYDFIPDRPIHLREELPIPEGALKSLEEHADLLSNIRLRFDGVRDHAGVAVGVFAIVGDVDKQVPAMGRVRAKPRGEIWVAVEGKFPTYLDVSGNIEADLANDEMAMKGSGTFSIGGSFGYERKK